MKVVALGGLISQYRYLNLFIFNFLRQIFNLQFALEIVGICILHLPPPKLRELYTVVLVSMADSHMN
jgi:hypothetical protein